MKNTVSRKRQPKDPLTQRSTSRHQATLLSPALISRGIFLPVSVGVFAVVLLLLLDDPGYLQLTFDEGIYLTGAAQVSEGAQPYRDFFALTGPGVYWLYGALFSVFGKSLLAARLFLFFEIGVVNAVAVVFYRVCTRSIALTLALSGWLVVFTATTRYRLHINHRWDSMFFTVLAGGCVLLSSRYVEQALLWTFLAGLLSGAAILMTPPVATITLAILSFYYVSRSTRKLMLYYSGGVLVLLSLANLPFLQGTSLGALVSASTWTSSHYSSANHVWFGFFDIPAAPSSLWSGSYFSALIQSVTPTIAAIASIAVVVILRPRMPLPRPVALAAVLGFALLIATYPRMAANQLAFAVPLLLAPLGWSVSGKSPKIQTVFITSVGVLSCVLLFNVSNNKALQEIDTAVGPVRCSPFDCAVLHNILEHTGRNEQILVYPYLPILYSITGTRPVSYYSYLQPGMMDSVDEERVISDCKRGLPSLIIWRRLTRKQIERIWPSTDWTRAHFPDLEAYIVANFHQLPTPVGFPVEYWAPN